MGDFKIIESPLVDILREYVSKRDKLTEREGTAIADILVRLASPMVLSKPLKELNK